MNFKVGDVMFVRDSEKNPYTIIRVVDITEETCKIQLLKNFNYKGGLKIGQVEALRVNIEQELKRCKCSWTKIDDNFDLVECLF